MAVATETLETLPPMPQLMLNTEGKPAIPAWVPPAETKLEDIEWQPLRTLDLSLLDGTPEQQKECLETFSAAVQNEGFMLIKNFGVAPEQMQRIYDLANWTINGDALSAQDRKDYEWDFEHGNWTGYKPPKGWNEKGRDLPDTLEFYNWYGECWEKDLIPPKLRAFQDEILAYAQHMYFQVARRVLVVLSRILGLHDDYLWKKVAAKGGPLPFSSYCRFQGVHPVPPEQRASTVSLLQGHTDQGVITLIPGQPVTCLQMMGDDGKWRYVPYMKDAIVANLGDVMEVVSGGIFKATRHRVIKPVSDQAKAERISVISFNHAQASLPMEPIWDAPLIKTQGVNKSSQVYGALVKAQEEGQQPMTFVEWRTKAYKLAQAEQKVVMIHGKAHSENLVGGVKVYREI